MAPAAGRLPGAVVLDARGQVVAASAGVAPLVDQAASALRFGPAPLEGAAPGLQEGWVEDPAGRRLPAMAEVIPLAGAGAVVLLTGPGDPEGAPPLFSAFFHDLKSPLATSLLLIQTLGMELRAAGERAAELADGYLPRIEQELGRLSTLVGLAGALRPPEGGPLEGKELGGMVAAAARRQARLLAREGVPLRQEGGPPAVVFVAEAELHALIGALITALVEGGGRGGVALRHGPGAGEAFVEVEAEGVDRLDVAAALGPTPVAPERAGWLEVGLMIARALARRAGGRVEHHPGPGAAGMRLRLWLPGR